MRLWRILLIGLPAALLLAAWIGPRLLDWEAQHDRVAAIAEARLGRPVAFGGPLRVTLLPQPMVEASQVLVGGADDDGLGVTARALRLRLGLLPLLAGRLEPRDLVLVGADVRLPWPPESIAALSPPPWLTGFDARIEDSRVSVGGAVLEGVAARLAAPGPLDSVRTEGSFTSRGAPVRFEAVVGRPGFDGVATLDVVLAAQGASATARGVLLAEGGFEGRIEATGADLSALIAAPPGPFRASGRVLVTAELAAADDLALDLGGVSGRGAATFRFAPAPRLDVALALARLDLDAWIGALRAATPPPLPMGLDLSAEVAGFGGQTLRRLRGGVVREGNRLTLSGISAVLPGEALLEASGTARGAMLDLAVHVAAPNLRATLAALGLGVERIDPARLRAFDARARIVLEPTQLAMPELTGTLDGMRVSGAGVLRFGARPALGLGLTLDRLDLEGLLPPIAGWSDALRATPGFDANLRLAAETVTWTGGMAERATVDAALEAGRLGLRRASARIGGADLVLAGTAALGAQPRFADLVFEAAASSTAGIAGMLAPDLALPQGLAELPFRLRLTGGGTTEALALVTEGEIGELRLEAQTSLNLPHDRGGGTVTLRHPGAQRLALLLGAAAPPAWLGEGSFSLIANLAAARTGITSESLELIAGGLRARGQGGLSFEGARPRLAGSIAAERLPLPDLPGRAAGPLDLSLLSAFDADVALEAGEVASPDLPALRGLVARVTLADGRLAFDGLRASLGGGALEGRIAIDAAAQPPALSGALGLTAATLSGPLFGTPFDIASGQIHAQGRFAAHGHAPAALLSTLAGEGRFAVSNGVLAGVALAGASGAATLEDAVAAEEGVRAALAGGATALDRLEGGWRASAGIVTLDGVRLAGEGGATGEISGSLDLTRGGMDLRFSVQPGPDQAPPIVLRVTGPAQAPRRQPEVAPWARWRAER